MRINHYHFVFYLVVSLILSSCAKTQYVVLSAEQRRYTIDSRYDSAPDNDAVAFVAPYKARIDSIMSPVVGRAACDMSSSKPESKLSNLLSDVLIWAAEAYGEKPLFAVYNIMGIRSSFSKGNITIGDVIDVAPFENKICFMTMKGADVTELFRQIAVRGGEGVSGSVRCKISKGGQLRSLTINGEEIKPEADYRIATIDYLAEGNDGMPAFKKGTMCNMPKESKNNLRNIIMDYLRTLDKEGKEANSEIEGRMVVED